MLRIALILLAFLPTSALAECENPRPGKGCLTAKIIRLPPPKPAPPPVEIGEIIPRGKYSMVLNARWYGLPDARDGWIYFRIEDEVYRVDYQTMEVLERATSETSANWPSG